MLDWLKKIGGTKAPANKAGLDAKSLERLSNDLGRLEEVSPELAARTLRYVLDGEDESVLAGLAALMGGAQALAFLSTGNSHFKDAIADRRLFFQEVKTTDAEFFIRLGRVYEALTRSTARQTFDAFGEPGLEWLEILLIEATQLRLNTWPRRCRACPALDAKMIEAMLVASGHPAELLVRAAFQPTLTPYYGAPLEVVFLTLKGLDESAVRHRNVLVMALHQADFKQRLYSLEMMVQAKVPAAPFIEELLALAPGSSKQVREKAEMILATAKDAARPAVERKIAEGDNDERGAAAQLLWNWQKEAARAFLVSRLTEETNKKVRRTIEELLAVASPVAAGDLPPLEVPPMTAMASEAPLGTETKRAWEDCFRKINDAIAGAAPGQPLQQRQLTAFSADTIEKAFERLQRPPNAKALLGQLPLAWWFKEIVQPLQEFWQRPELQPVHLVRFAAQAGGLPAREHDHYLFAGGGWMHLLMVAFRRSHPETGLRELGAAFDVTGLDAARVGRGLLYSYHEMPAPFGLPSALIWPYWVEHLDLLEKALTAPAGTSMDRYYQRYARRNAFHALATFPQAPPALVASLWKLALGPKGERAQAQRCLASLPDKVERLSSALEAGDADTRAAAAEWLGRSNDARGKDVLLGALKREKRDAVKGAMMTALESLGAPIDQFLDRKGLLKEAEKGVSKGIPEGLKWFPFEQLPPVHWADNEQEVDRVIVQWWLIQGFKLKNAEPGALLRRYCASLKPSEREALGQFVLEAWIGRDTSPRPGAEAEKEAMKRAQAAVQAAQHWAQYVKQNPQAAQYMGAYATPKTVEEYYAEILPVIQREPTGSAIASKGVLGLAGACAGSGAAPVVNRYLKDWYGMRAAQCRALLQMLAWVEHKTATQLLLAVGSRFRTKGIQEEANTQAQALAERRGWTVAELADRTIPSAGLDENGVLTLDFGPRQFTAKLDEKLDFVLSDSTGKVLKSLPEPRQDDDEAKAAEAKKIFSAAKKELKSVIAMQRDRLYEGMCTQRRWPFEDWNVYLNRHPIMRHHCQRLVWGLVRDGKLAQLFRPLADGSLTDAEDDPVTLQPEDEVGVAHECQVTPEQSLAWRRHLKDYDVAPLFDQFGRPKFELTEERRQEEELADFRGHLLEAFKLRSRATKLGYTRGQAQDGGWFLDYHKRFATLGIEAVLDFTGNSLPEENRVVALTGFHFERVNEENEAAMMGGQKMSLSEVPAVLVSECWNDFRQIAAEGTGFDPEWEKKSGF